jgi:hypothetical protein
MRTVDVAEPRPCRAACAQRSLESCLSCSKTMSGHSDCCEEAGKRPLRRILNTYISEKPDEAANAMNIGSLTLLDTEKSIPNNLYSSSW